MGCDGCAQTKWQTVLLFQSTQPEWAATVTPQNIEIMQGISIHAARMGCDGKVVRDMGYSFISIHAARMGCDLLPNKKAPTINISIHAARMGCD